MPKHPYCTPPYAWEFVYYLTLFKHLPNNQPVVIVPSRYAPETIRQRLFHGRRYIFETADDSPLAKYHAIATLTSIEVAPSYIAIKQAESFDATYALTLKNDPITSLIDSIHEFLKPATTSGAIYKAADLSALGLVTALTKSFTTQYGKLATFSVQPDGIVVRKALGKH